MRPVRVLSALIVLGVCSLASASQRSAPPAGSKIVGVQKLGRQLYLLTGGGGNSLAFVTDLGVVLVDTKLAGWGQPLLDAIRTVTTRPVTTIINTHSHVEQVGGNESFPTSVEIVAHENTRQYMDSLDAFKGAKVNYLPKLRFREKLTIGSGKDRVDLLYFGPAHTGGDAWVVFPTEHVAHVGDLVLAKQPPVIDLDHGGSALMYSETIAKAATALGGIDRFVPSQGALLTMTDLQEYARFTEDFRDGAVSAYHHGLGVSEAADAWSIPGRYRGYTTTLERARANVRVLFSELTRP